MRDFQAQKHAVLPTGCAVELRHVSKTYRVNNKELHALRDINLKVNAGEIFGIIGRSGAGKSTLVRCINMLERPTQGEIIVGDWRMTDLKASKLRRARRHIGMIFQHFNLLSSRTVFQNIALPLELERMPSRQIKSRVMSLLELVGLTPFAHKYVGQISGGQKQRVGIARALANNPRVLLSDEATSALDPETTRSTLALLKEVNKELGLTIIMITHQMEVVQRICDRVAVVEQGAVIEEGAVRDVFGQPKSLTTQALVGEAIGQVLPEETLENIITHAINTDLCIWQVSANHPDILMQLIKEFSLEISLIQALVEDYQGVPLGTLLVQVRGALQNRQAAVAWAQTVGVQIEEVASVQ